MAVWYLLHRQQVPFAWLWALGLLGISDAFLFRMSIITRQSLSLAMLALGYAYGFWKGSTGTWLSWVLFMCLDV